MVAQRKLTVAEYIAITDTLAESAGVIVTALGDEDTPSSAVDFAADARNVITALTEPEDAQVTVDLLPALISLVAALAGGSQLANYFAGFNSAVLTHLGEDLDDWLAEDGSRVHPDWKIFGNPAITADNVFPPVTVLGSYLLSGAGAGTYTDSAAVDPTVFGGAQIELEVMSEIGGANINVTCACVFADGSTGNKAGQIPSGSHVGDKVQLGTADDRVVDVTNVTVTLGTAADAFRVQTVEDR